MANIKSSKKDDRQIKKVTPKNHEYKATVKNAIRNCDKAIADNDKKVATKIYQTVQKTIDTAVGKNLIKKNTAAREKSRLNKKIKDMK